MSIKFTKNQLIRRIYLFVDIWISRKSLLEVRVKILSALPVATPYEITRCDFLKRGLL